MRAITVSHFQSAASIEGQIPPRQTSRNILRLVTSELTPSTVVISAHGDINASNADDLLAGVRHALGRHHDVIIDLTAVKFFGTEGLSVLDEINVALEQPHRMAVVPSSAVTRVLRLCTPASAHCRRLRHRRSTRRDAKPAPSCPKSGCRGALARLRRQAASAVAAVGSGLCVRCRDLGKRRSRSTSRRF